MKKVIAILFGIIIIIAAIYFFSDFFQNEEDYLPEGLEARFECANDEWVEAVYYNNEEEDSYAKLVFSDGREFTVYQAISASGARYLTEDQSIEFWTKGDEVVSIKENGEIIFEECKVVDETENNNQIANPASVHCQEQEGELEIRTMIDGSQKGFCLFEDGSECEEWAFLKGECKEGDSFCKDMCGDGVCQEITCFKTGCFCSESFETCPQDCL
jgi:putative hemolysin